MNDGTPYRGGDRIVVNTVNCFIQGIYLTGVDTKYSTHL